MHPVTSQTYTRIAICKNCKGWMAVVIESPSTGRCVTEMTKRALERGHSVRRVKTLEFKNDTELEMCCCKRKAGAQQREEANREQERQQQETFSL